MNISNFLSRLMIILNLICSVLTSFLLTIERKAVFLKEYRFQAGCALLQAINLPTRFAIPLVIITPPCNINKFAVLGL